MKWTQKRTIPARVVAVLLIAVACTSAPTSNQSLVMETFARNSDGYADISTEQLAELLEEREVTLVNVHIPFEGEIPGTDVHIAYDEIAEHLDQLPGQDEPIVLYCRSGSMSTTAAQALASLGYTNVAELDGGMIDWAAAGYNLAGN